MNLPQGPRVSEMVLTTDAMANWGHIFARIRWCEQWETQTPRSIRRIEHCREDASGLLDGN